MPPEALIHVEVAGALPQLDGPVGIALPRGARIADALAALGARTDGVAAFGVWGRRATVETRLHDGDRIECYRPLEIDPKVARRARVQRRVSG